MEDEKPNNWGWRFVYFFLMMLPLDYYITNVFFQNVSIISFWKEIVLIIVLIFAFLNVVKQRKITYNMPVILMIFLIWYLFILALTETHLSASFAALRLYSEPLLFYIAVMNLPNIDGKFFLKLVRTLTIEFGIISFFGIYQAFILGQVFLENSIFHTAQLDNSFYIAGKYGILRVNATFVSPLDFALYAVLLLIFRISLNDSIKSTVIEKISLAFIIGALLGSVTRSAILGFIITLFLLVVKRAGLKGIIKILVGSVITLIPLLILDNFLLKGTIAQQISKSFSTTVGGSDPSAIAHANALSEGLKALGNSAIQWIHGIGLGINGPRAIQYVVNPNLVESSYYLILFETGIIGLILYLLIFLLLCVQQPSNIMYSKSVPYLTIALLIPLIFLPFIQSLPPIMLFFLLVAILAKVRRKNDLIDNSIFMLKD